MVLGVAVASLVLAGGHVPQDGWRELTNRQKDVTIRVPPSWNALDTKDDQVNQALAVWSEANEHFVDYIQWMSKREDIDLLAFDLADSPEDNAIDSVLVQVQRGADVDPLQLSVIGYQITKQLHSVDKPDHLVVKKHVGQTLVYTATLESRLRGGQKLRSQTLGYVFCWGKHLVTVSFSTGEGQLQSKKALFEKVFSSIATRSAR